MKELHVSIEKNGVFISVGKIVGDGPSETRFQYSNEYCAGNGTPISISLPIQEEKFSSERTAGFFEGLLPEGFTRRMVAQWMQVDEGDYLSILHGLGRECLGALCITEDGETAEASYERINERQVQDLAAEGVTKSAELVTKSHLSLTGASGKVGLYFDPPTNAWYLPHGTAPSTHIVKQSHVRLEAIVTNERLSLMTAASRKVPFSPSIQKLWSTPPGPCTMASAKISLPISLSVLKSSEVPATGAISPVGMSSPSAGVKYSAFTCNKWLYTVLEASAFKLK